MINCRSRIFKTIYIKVRSKIVYCLPLTILLFSINDSIGQSAELLEVDSILTIALWKDFEKDSISTSCLERYGKLRKKVWNQYCHKLLIEFDPLIKTVFDKPIAADSLSIRKALMRHGYDVEKHIFTYQEALPYYRMAHDYLKHEYILTDPYYWNIENLIFNAYTRQGDYEKALVFATKTEKALTYQDDYRLSRLSTNFGTLYEALGQVEKAKRKYLLGRKVAQQKNYLNGEISNEQGLLGLYLEQGDSVHSKIILDQLKLTIKKHKEEYPDDYNFRVQAEILYNQSLSKFYSLVGKPKKAVEYYSLAIQKQKEISTGYINRDLAKLHVDFARIFYKENQFAQALKELKSSLNSLGLGSLLQIGKEKIYGENTLLDIYLLYGKIMLADFYKSNNTSALIDASNGIELGLLAGEMLIQSQSLKESKLLAIQSYRELVELGIQIKYLQGQGIDEQALLALFRKSKASLLDITQAENQKIESFSEIDKKTWFARKSEMASIRNAINHSREGQDSLYSLLLDLKTNNDSLLEKYKKADQSHFKGPFIDYVLTQNDVYSINNFNGQLEFFNHGASKRLVELQEELNEGIRNQGEVNLALTELYTLLFSPLKSLPESFSVIVDRQLYYIPFDALLRNGRYLLEDHILDIRLSQQIRIRSLADKKNEGLFIAPLYSNASEDLSRAERGGIYKLPFAKLELEAVKKAYPNVVSVKEKLSKEAFLSNLKGKPFLHFAGHALVNKDDAFLALSDQIDNDDFKINIEEISNLESQLQTVILSACETGLGQLAYGEGVLSLGRAWIDAGVDDLVYSLWSVNDQSTSKLMDHFYQEQTQHPIQEALRNAKLSYLKQAKSTYKHPYYWAAFVPVTQSNQPHTYENGHFTLWLIGGVTLFLIFFLFYKKYS